MSHGRGASYQFEDALVTQVLGERLDQRQLIRVLAYASYSAAARLANVYGQQLSERVGFAEVSQ